MKLLLIPIICLILGLGAGVGGAMVLLPEPEVSEVTIENENGQNAEPINDEIYEPQDEADSAVEYVNLSSQFIVPLLSNGKVEEIVVMAISLEVLEGAMQDVLMNEPKLRAAFLQTLFNHANNGGFSGNFTALSTMESLRRELHTIARIISSDIVTDVLILDIVRQQP
jgi:flagellar basal body-associated protein FliL